MRAWTPMRNAALLAGGVLLTLSFAGPSRAATIRIDIGGTVTTANPGGQAMQALGPFTARILLDSLSPDQGGGGSRIASFNDDGVPPAMISFRVDGTEFSGPAQEDNEVIYSRQTTRDLLSVDTIGSDAGERTVFFDGTLPMDFFGAGPYSLDQLVGLMLASLGTPLVTIYDDFNGDLLARGDVTSLSVRLVPEPALLVLALAALPGLVRRARPR